MWNHQLREPKINKTGNHKVNLTHFSPSYLLRCSFETLRFVRELWDCNYNKRRKIEKRKCVLSFLLITNVTLLTPMKRIASLFCLSFWQSSLYLQEGWEYLKLFDKYKMTNDAWFWPVKCFIEGFIFPAKYWFFILLLKSLQHIIVFASKNTSMFYWRLFVIYYFLFERATSTNL